MNANAIARVILGFVLAPQAGTLVLILWMCVSDSSPVLACLAGSGEMLLFFAWLVALFGYPSVLVLGVPLLLVLRRYQLLRAAPLALAGIAIGFVAAGLFFLVEEKYSVIGMFDWLPFSLRAGVPLAGVVAGLAFWALAVVRNRALTAG
jgi:hypothetical protein